MAKNCATKCGGFWIYSCCMPTEFGAIDQRSFVKATTKVRVADDPLCQVAGRPFLQTPIEESSCRTGLAQGV